MIETRGKCPECGKYIRIPIEIPSLVNPRSTNKGYRCDRCSHNQLTLGNCEKEASERLGIGMRETHSYWNESGKEIRPPEDYNRFRCAKKFRRIGAILSQRKNRNKKKVKE